MPVLFTIESSQPRHSYHFHYSNGADVTDVDPEKQTVTVQEFRGGCDGDYRRHAPKVLNLRTSKEISSFYNRWLQKGTNARNADAAMRWLRDRLGYQACPLCAQRREIGWLTPTSASCWYCGYGEIVKWRVEVIFTPAIGRLREELREALQKSGQFISISSLGGQMLMTFQSCNLLQFIENGGGELKLPLMTYYVGSPEGVSHILRFVAVLSGTQLVEIRKFD